MTDRSSQGWPALRVAVGSAVLLTALLGASGPGVAHGYHLSVDPQLSDDGTVTVETLFAMSDGFLVLHADDDGIGDPVGHVPVTIGYQTGVDVVADDRFWDAVTGNETLWVAVHVDDGDGAFDPATDPIARFAGSEAATTVHVGKNDRGRTYVLSEGRTQRAPTPAVYVRRVGLAEDGFVVLRTAGDDGRVVGHVPLAAGVHHHVRIRLNESFFASAEEWTTLRAVVHYDDGDGEFTASDPPVTVEGRPIASTLTVQKTDETRVTPTLATAASTTTPAADANTSPTPGLVTTASPPPDGPGTANSASPADPATVDTPGLGAPVAVAALAAVVTIVAFALRRRQ